MQTLWNNYRYLIMRRVTQIALLVLYFGANAWGWKILQGNLSSSLVFGLVPLSDPFAALQMLAAGALLATNLLIGAGIIAAFYLIVGGRLFCSWVCPINMITDAANYLRRKLQIDKLPNRHSVSRKMRYWILALSLILSFFMGVTAFEFVSPISMMHRGIIFGLGFGWAAMLIIFLFDLFVLTNGWCGHVCPLGGFYSLLGNFSLIRVKHT
ncbi:MAG TPA: quinol dehydrogenase ferredoxin subunit NapH, partial [Sulfurimonas sp. UBA12504]